MLPSGVVARELDASDAAALLAFCRECAGFFTLVTGESPAPGAARQLLESRPPGVPATRKHVVGFWRDETLVAIVDLLEEYPDAGDWYVGLLLLLPDERGRGFGRGVWMAVETLIRDATGHRVRLIVQEQNPGALLFWRAVGFTTHGTVEQHLRVRTNICWCLEKTLA